MKAIRKSHHGIVYDCIGKLYRLACDYRIDIKLHPKRRIDVGAYITLTPNGILTIREGYVWDGPSGPTIDTENFMRGSLVHDALYQALRLGVFLKQFVGANGQLWDHDRIRLCADEWIKYICLEDGMSSFRAGYVYRVLRVFGAKHAKLGKGWRKDKKLRD